MGSTPPFVDIHCHLIPGIDDGASNLRESLAMAQMAVEDGTNTIVATPHQLGNYSENTAELIREHVNGLQRALLSRNIALDVLPGADVRIEPEMLQLIARDEVLTLGDHRRHVLLELPHELYFPLEPLLAQMDRKQLVGILSHPERNQGILRDNAVIEPLVARGCLMQVTAGSLIGTFGPASRQLSEWMLGQGYVHFISTDAHGVKSRRPLMRRAFERVMELTDEATATKLCCEFPALVASGKEVPGGKVTRRRRSLFSWLRGGRAA